MDGTSLGEASLDRQVSKRSVKLGMKRGLALRCPNCGEGKLFRRFLKVSDCCESCGIDNSVFPADDAPPYLTLVLAGHIIVPLYMATERAFSLPIWLQASIWLPLTLVMSVVLLPYIKGGVLGICWANDIRRDQPGR